MSNTPPDPSRPGWFKGMFGSPASDQAEVPLAIPVSGDNGDELPVATPVPPAEAAESAEPPAEEPPAAEPVAEAVEAEPAEVTVEEVVAVPTTIDCPVCSSVSPLASEYCSDCGYHFSKADRDAVVAGTPVAALAAPAAEVAAPGERVKDRYELRELVSDRLGVQRYRAFDHGEGRAVHVIRQALPPELPEPEPLPEPLPASEEDSEELMPVLDELSFGDPVPGAFPMTDILGTAPVWPSIGWERRLLNTLESPGLPREVEHFTDDKYEYLVEEVPTGQILWDVWDDPDTGSATKFRALAELAELLHNLHQCNAMVEGLRPDIVVIDSGTVRLTDLSDLLPLPFPPDAPVRGRLYTAPELTNGFGVADARADLYHFGAMLYALHEHRELTERDFDKGEAKPFIPRYPDCHPALGRLMMKTFRKQVEARFPTDEAGKTDPSGFVELIRTLNVLARTYDNVRLEVACWTSTGIVRTGNEDAFAIMHGVESRQDDQGEACLIILCDGMGGYEAGEVAAALTIQTLRQHLSKMRPFCAAAGQSPFLLDALESPPKDEGHAPPPSNIDEIKKQLKAALREANKLVFQTSRAPGSKRRGMGCTAEVVYIDGRNVIVGHVGDSRTYHMHEGRLVQLTRDQTLVNRLVELGTLSAEDAETHPRRNELQQAIGGQPDVDPGLYHGKLVVGDWVIVCSDGLTNHVNSKDLQQMLGAEAWSAETAARRLVNLTLIEGATDNVTVVAVRAT